jgi:phenylacetate-CoA ligase
MALLRYLPRFQQAYRELDALAQRETWSHTEIEAWQLERLNAVWQHAVNHVPYYRMLTGQSDLPRKFASLAEFQALVPVLPKAVVRNRPWDFLSRNAASGSWHRTGGSTGTPMGVYWAKQSHLETLRAKYRMEAMWGLDIFDRKVFLWGHSGSFAPGLSGRVAKLRRPVEDKLRNRLRLSAYRMGQRDLLSYLRQIEKFQPASMYGYSTAMCLLAEEAAAHGVGCDSLKLAILSGEPAFPHILKTVKRAFGAAAAIEYGAVECGFIANQFTDGTLRVREDMTLVETLPRDDGLFDIVITVLNNPSFPLLRYAIEDLTDAPLTIPESGFAVLHNINGRRNDLVVSRSGRFVHPQGIKHVFEHCPAVRRIQASQDVSGKLSVLVETKSVNVQFDVREAERQLQMLLEGYPVSVQTVEFIPGTLAGKHRWIVSELAERRLVGKSCQQREP